jgi:formylglycine-generating enzyme required for sulfatase activity
MSSVVNLKTFTFETVSVDRNGEIGDRRSGMAEYFTVSLGDGVAMDLVSIPGGKFMMGDERHHQDEQPVHQVTVPAFFMSRYPITQAQYRAIMGEHAGFGLGADCPIERVSWDEAIEFCGKLSQQTGDLYTLPSEAQWEYACRARTQTAFHFGETITPEVVNYNGDYPYAGAPTGENRELATPVGSFPPNQFGLYDMHGNVWEWCLDEYQASYHHAPDDGSVWTTSLVPSDLKRVMRGGAWDYVARGCRSAVRGSLAPRSRVAGCGFRVVWMRSVMSFGK